MKTLLKLLKPYTWQLVAVSAVDMLSTVLALLMPYVMSAIVDEGISKENMQVVTAGCALMALFAVLSLTFSLIAAKINTRITASYTGDVCCATFGTINSLSFSQYSKIGPSALLTRSTDDIFNIEGAASSLVYTLVTVPVMIVGSCVLAFTADVWLALIFVASIVPVMLLVYLIVRPLDKMWEKSDKYVDEQNKIVRERLTALRVIRAFNKEEREHGRIKDATEKMSHHMIRANVRGGCTDPLALLLMNIATVVMVAVGGIRAEAGTLSSSGALIATLQYVALISNAILNLAWTIAWLPRLKVAIGRINDVYSLPREDEGADSEAAPFGDGSPTEIRMSEVTFTYPDASLPAVENISFEVLAGERVAIIGGTGSGKTTLVRLLLALHRADSGEIYVGGERYGDISRHRVRSHFSAALQRGMIFEGSVRDNVKMGKPDATDAELMRVLDDCRMSEFVASHEGGLDYQLVGMGLNVSGGQKQRLNIARAVLREAGIYIFDDSFSALDFYTESLIKQRLCERLESKTQIFVTQRVSTAMSAERIYVMDKGRIVDCATHTELLERCPIYREICVSQLGEDVIEGEAV